MRLDRERLAQASDEHRLVRTMFGEVACMCGGYAGPGAGVSAAEAWRSHWLNSIADAYEATTPTGTDGPVPGSSAPAPAADSHPGGPTASGA